jgi:hypothetical protein
MKKKIMTSLVLCAFMMFVMPIGVQAQAGQNSELLSLIYTIDDGDVKTEGGDFSVDENSFEFWVAVNTTIPDDVMMSNNVAAGPWVDSLQVWFDGTEQDVIGVLSYTGDLSNNTYGDSVDIRVRVEGNFDFLAEPVRNVLIYNELEMTISFPSNDDSNSLLMTLIITFGSLGIGVLIVILILFRRVKRR